MICDCNKSYLPDLPKSSCLENFGQIQKIAFFKLTDNLNLPWQAFDEAAIGEKVEQKVAWTRYLSAMNYSKVVISPYIQNPANEAGESVEFGGGNETLDGMPILMGRNRSKFTAVVRSSTQDVIKVLKEYECFAARKDLGVMLFNSHSQIGARIGTDGESVFPIPIRTFFVGDKTFGGLEQPDGNEISFNFYPNWSNDFKVFNAEFNPLEL